MIYTKVFVQVRLILKMAVIDLVKSENPTGSITLVALSRLKTISSIIYEIYDLTCPHLIQINNKAIVKQSFLKNKHY